MNTAHAKALVARTLEEVKAGGKSDAYYVGLMEATLEIILRDLKEGA